MKKTNNNNKSCGKSNNSKSKFAAALAAFALIPAAVFGAENAASAGKLVIDGSTTVGPIAKAFAEAYAKANPGADVSVSESGSGNGAKALLNGACDIATLSRPLKDAEKSAMEAKGVKPVVRVAAFDALCVVVNPANRVKGLSAEQLRDIYTGKISDWKEVGGFPGRIVLINRDTNSGSYESFKEMVLGAGAEVAPTAEHAGSNGAVRQRVAATKGAVAYVGLGFIDRSVKALEIGGVMPTAETVADKKYPLSRELYMITNGEPAADSAAGKFLAMLDDEAGRGILSEVGFVPVPVPAAGKGKGEGKGE